MRENRLTEAQEGIWFAQRLDPANPIFNTSQFVEILGALDVPAFEAAVAAAIDEAEALSLTFRETETGAMQRIDPAARPRMTARDLRGTPDAERIARADMAADTGRPVDLGRGPVAAFTLYRIGEGRFFWYERAHHLALDGYAMVMLTRRVGDLYSAATGGGAAPPAFAPLARAWAEDDAYRDATRREDDLARWDAHLEGLPEIESLAIGPAVSAHTFRRARRALDPAFGTALDARSEAAGCGWPDALVALAGSYCRRFAGGGEAVLGVPHMGRMGSKAARVPCTMVNVVPLRLDADEDRPLEDYLCDVAAALKRDRRHGRFRGEALRRHLGRIGAARRLYGPMINLLPFEAAPRMAGLETRLHVLGAGSVDDITFAFRGDPRAGLTLEVDANPDLYAAPEIEAHADRLSHFLAAAVAAGSLSDIPLAMPAERHRWIVRANETDRPVPDTTLAALLERQMRETPRAVALEMGAERLSYADLDARSAALASAIAARGAGAGAIVAVALPRSIELAVSLVAILRAGCAYLPLDPEDPAARRAGMIEAARPALLIAHDDMAVSGTPRIAPSDGMPGTAPPPPGPRDRAYVIFTSGSTGAPKGVEVAHRAIVNRLLWMRDRYGIGPQDRVLQKTPATFDVSVWEFFLPLISGARLVVAPPGAHRDPAAIAGLVRARGITTLHFVPSMLALFLQAPQAAGLSPARVFCSGEALPAALRDRFHRTIRAELHNLYGPTEAAVDVSHWHAGPDDRSVPVPIGHPVWNTRLYVLDAHLRPLPAGVTGTLFIAGRQLARGYLGRPDLTAERFVPDPFRPGERMYDTGDKARLREDGAVVFLGRADHQLKIRGVRIEPEEVEAGLRRTGLVRDVVVGTCAGPDGDARLVAHVVPAGDATGEDIRIAASDHLSQGMRPVSVVTMAALPLSANGKLDRKALPAARWVDAQGRAAAPGPETVVARAMAAVLGREGLPRADGDFFRLGGDSLSAVRLLLRIEEETGTQIGLGTLFERPTVEGIAAALSTAGLSHDSGIGPTIRLGGGRAAAPLFAVHPAGGLSWCYRDLARALDGRPVHGLQSPALDPARPTPPSLTDLAETYVEHILSVPRDGPIHLVGWSLGGIVAQEIAVCLHARGLPVGIVALLDAYPSDCWRDEPEPDRAAALRALLAIAGFDPEAHPDLADRSAILDFLRRRGSPLGLLPPAVTDGVIRSVQDTNRLVRRHRERVFAGPLLHVTAALEPHGAARRPQAWAPYCDRLDIVPMPCRHADLVGPWASVGLAAALASRWEDPTGGRER